MSAAGGSAGSGNAAGGSAQPNDYDLLLSICNRLKERFMLQGSLPMTIERDSTGFKLTIATPKEALMVHVSCCCFQMQVRIQMPKPASSLSAMYSRFQNEFRRLHTGQTPVTDITNKQTSLIFMFKPPQEARDRGNVHWLRDHMRTLLTCAMLAAWHEDLQLYTGVALGCYDYNSVYALGQDAGGQGDGLDQASRERQARLREAGSSRIVDIPASAPSMAQVRPRESGAAEDLRAVRPRVYAHHFDASQLVNNMAPARAPVVAVVPLSEAELQALVPAAGGAGAGHMQQQQGLDAELDEVLRPRVSEAGARAVICLKAEVPGRKTSLVEGWIHMSEHERSNISGILNSKFSTCTTLESCWQTFLSNRKLDLQMYSGHEYHSRQKMRWDYMLIRMNTLWEQAKNSDELEKLRFHKNPIEVEAQVNSALNQLKKLDNHLRLADLCEEIFEKILFSPSRDFRLRSEFFHSISRKLQPDMLTLILREEDFMERQAIFSLIDLHTKKMETMCKNLSEGVDVRQPDGTIVRMPHKITFQYQKEDNGSRFSLDIQPMFPNIQFSVRLLRDYSVVFEVNQAQTLREVEKLRDTCLLFLQREIHRLVSQNLEIHSKSTDTILTWFINRKTGFYATANILQSLLVTFVAHFLREERHEIRFDAPPVAQHELDLPNDVKDILARGRAANDQPAPIGEGGPGV